MTIPNHKILFPEGMAIAGLIHFATGKHRPALFWCLISAVAEPIGAVVGWMIIGATLNKLTFGVLYAAVGGMLISLCLKEFLPISYACAHDHKSFVPRGVFGGMALMALSLVLLAYIGVEKA